MRVLASDREMLAQPRTSIRLDARGNLSWSNIVEPSNILPEHCAKVLFTDPLCINLTSIHPNVHIDVSGEEKTNSYTMISTSFSTICSVEMIIK